MASRALDSFRALTCIAFAAWMAAMQCTVGAEGFPVAGMGCVLFNNMEQEQIITDIPPQVYLTLERRNLMKEYYDLTQTLFEAPKGSLGNWKSSALARAIHIKGHDEIFEAKNVSLFITRTDGDVGSKIHLCVVDRIREPTFFPPDIYSPGKSVPFGLEGGTGCTMYPKECERLRRYTARLPEGVYAQSLQGRTVESDKVLMPVELMKFLDKKGAVGVNMEMAALINTGDRTAIDTASIVRSFKSQFLAKGVHVYFALKGLNWYSCTNYEKRTRGLCDRRKFEFTDSWLEYADAAVVGESHTPCADDKCEYLEEVVAMYDDCRNGSAELIKAKTQQLESDPKRKGCKKVAGAVRRTGKKSECKCENENARVYCGREVVGERKFNMDSLRSSEACQTQGVYCSVRACLMPYLAVPMEP